MLPTFFTGEAILKALAIRNPTQAKLDRLLMPIKPPDIKDEELGTRQPLGREARGILPQRTGSPSIGSVP